LNIIEFKNVSKVFGEQKALSNISLNIEHGEFVTLIGPSGCGKTTLLRIINGMVKHTSGQVKVYGKDMDEWDLIKLRRKIGYVIQHIGLFPHMRIWENITYVMRLEGASAEKRRQRAQELIGLVNLDQSYLDRYPRQLSGGEQQRIGVLRALATDPDIILMDEPFGAVDEINRKVLQDEFIALYKKLDKTIVFVTHDIEEAMRLGTRIVLMNAGGIVSAGTRKDMLFSEDPFVSNFFKTKDFLSYINITSVGEVMEKNDIMMSRTIYREQSIAEGLKVLIKEELESLTVLDDKDCPIGLFTMASMRSL
jgi:osmoprotectant transport system ATP-binding protein